MKTFIIILALSVSSYASLSYTDEFAFEDAVKLAKQLKLSEIEAIEKQLDPVEKRAVFDPNGNPIDLSNVQNEVVVDPKGHFCCQQEHIQNKNWNTKEHTKVVSEYRHVTFNHKTGYTKCGALGWSRCSLYKEGYAQQLFTYTQIIEVEDVKFCPTEHITCCHGYTKIADGNCLRLDDLHNNLPLADSLCRMARLGLLESSKKPEHCPSDVQQ